MRLGIDLRCLPADGSPGSGVAHASRAITRAIIEDGRTAVVPYVPRGARFERGGTVVELAGARRSDLIKGLKEQPCDVLFVPSGAVSPGLPVRAVPWVHDVDIFDHPEWFPQAWWKRWLTTSFFLRGLRGAACVFAVSEYTKAAIERLAPSLTGSVVTTGEGGDEVLAAMTDAVREQAKHDAQTHLVPRGVTRPFVLVLGTLEPRKNAELVCDIWPDVVARVPGVDLVIAGREGWKTGPIKAAMGRCRAGLEGRDSKLVRLTDVSDDTRRDLLLGASLVLVPSWSEGFGLAAFEAVQAGTPVLASNRGALPEVVGRGDWLLDPTDRRAWRDAVIRLLTDLVFRQRVAERQTVAKSRWTWESAAQRILDVLTA